MLQIVIATAVLAHGVGHVLFLVPALRIAEWGQTSHSWLLTSTIGDTLARGVAVVVWTAAIALFASAVAGFVTEQSWWRQTAVAGAVVSMVGIVAFWDGLPAGNAFFALVFDAVVLASVLWLHWPTTEVAGS